MLNIKEINKIKDMYYEKHYSVTFISRSMKISKSNPSSLKLLLRENAIFFITLY